MDRENFDEALQAFRQRVPFEPFTVTLVNGKSYEVDFPDALTARDGLAVYHGPNRVLVIFDYAGVASLTSGLRAPSGTDGDESDA